MFQCIGKGGNNLDIETRLTNLENLVNSLISKINNDKFYSDADTAGVRKSVGDLVPYTQTKTAYIGDTEITFYDTPETGNVTVFFDHPYTMERVADKITLTFAPLEDITDITISIV